MNIIELVEDPGGCNYSISHAVFWVFIIGSPIVMIFSSIVIYTFFKIKDCRKPPGDLFLIISMSDFVLAVHWFTTACGS